ncbi:MAG: Rrf2 family transcriptional regulator [Clostridia bacterium]|nr:Rrf2 family transcriptional regulator [Clostridia bacterium]
MRASKRFPTAVHALLFVAVLSPKKRVTSSLAAESAGSNPVIIRNIFLDLSRCGLIAAAPGKNGGVVLAKDAKEITLWDIYEAVEPNDAEEIFSIHDDDASETPIGKNFYRILYPHMEEAVSAMKASMEQVTLDTLKAELTALIDSGEAEDVSAEIPWLDLQMRST